MSRLVLAVAAVAFCATTAFGGIVTYVPPGSSDLYDLDHYNYYTWGFDKAWSKDEKVLSATLTFSNIYDWTNEYNVLYVRLLDDAKSGVKTFTDDQAFGDAMAGHGISLVTYSNLPTTPQTLTYTLTPSQIATFNTYADGKLGLSFDPDCHFYNDGVSFTVEYGSVGAPEPGTLVLLGLGIAGLVAKRRRSKLA